MRRPFDNACWIWDDGNPAPINAYRYFRKSFTVPEQWAHRQTLRIAADTRYRLFVDSAWLGDGSAPSAKGTISYDEYAIAASPGEQVSIGVIVHYVGVPMFSHHRNRGGLIVDLAEFATDGSWQVATTSEYLPGGPRWSPMLGFSEVFDASLWPGWNPNRDEVEDEQFASRWRPATVVEKAYGASWPSMLLAAPRFQQAVTDSMARSASLIEYGSCVRGGGNGAAERTTTDVCLPATPGLVEMVVFHSEPMFKVTASSGDVYLTFDFGSEVSGYPLVAYRSSSGFEAEDGYIDIAYAEALCPGETPSGIRTCEKQSDRNFADQFLVKPHATYEYIPFMSRTFRYIRIVVRNVDGELLLETPYLARPSGSWTASAYEPFDRSGQLPARLPMQSVFACSDSRIDAIYEVGKRTLELCMGDQFMDTPMRERAQYIGDARIEAIGARYALGDSNLHARFLRQTAMSQHQDGRLDPVGPGEWDVLEPNKPIPGYVAIYILSVFDYYQMTGDGALVQEVMPALLKALAWLGSYGGAEGGLLISLPGWNFTDWAPGLDQGTDGINGAVNLLYLLALRAAERLAKLSGDAAAAVSHGLRANMIAAAFDSLFWNPIRGVYVDSVIEGEPSPLASQQVNSLALLAGIGSEARQLSVAERLLSDGSLTQTGTPYFGYYLIQALGQGGREADALSYIRERWGAMLDAGATAWWETWDGMQSRCHGWSVGPTIWLPQHVLGVTAHEPGFATVNIAPKLCGLAWAKGIVPIPQGEVQVSWLLKGRKLTLDVTVPTGVLLRPILPCELSDEITIDGQGAREDQIVVRTATTAEIAVLPGSGYRFGITGYALT